jgi:hypothetical protein
MGNRFRSMAGYKALITAHGVLAAIAFLFVIPAAIFMARFYHRNPRTALRVHIWLQIAAVLLSTAAIICSFQAVGLERSLSNPHHGIGVALYTLVMVQFLGGALIHKLEKGKERFKIPLKLMVCRHHAQLRQPLIFADPSMARPYYCTTWTCTNSPRPDSIWITIGLVHTLRRLDLHSGHPLLRPFLQDPTRDGL